MGPRRGLSRAVPRVVGAEPGSTSREAGGDPRRGDRPGAHADRAARRPDRRRGTRLPDRVEALVNDAWWTVVLVGTATIAIKGAGPVLLGGRPLPERSAA